MNTERIDVLAVMDEAAGILGGETFVCGRDMIAARAAVAELIAKADTVEKALQNLIAAGHAHPSYATHADDLRHALARVQGGAA